MCHYVTLLSLCSLITEVFYILSYPELLLLPPFSPISSNLLIYFGHPEHSESFGSRATFKKNYIFNLASYLL